jgi:hypothetical protein
MFDITNKDGIYCSPPYFLTKQMKYPFVGFRCPHFVFDCSKVVFMFNSRSEAHTVPRNQMKLHSICLRGGNHVWASQQGKWDDEEAKKEYTFVNEKPGAGLMNELKIEKVGQDVVSVLRCSGIRAWGTFGAACA